MTDNLKTLIQEHNTISRQIAVETDKFNKSQSTLADLGNQQAALMTRIEAARNDPKRVHMETIDRLLEEAKQALVKAGELGEQHKIDFYFTTPKGNNEQFKWQHSACYGEDAWYSEGTHSYRWDSSDRNCY